MGILSSDSSDGIALLGMDLLTEKRRGHVPMRIVMVWIVTIILIFTISLGWYVSQPIVIGVSRGLKSSITDANGKLVATAVEYVSYAWGPILNIFVLLWAVISSQKRDVESEIYG